MGQRFPQPHAELDGEVHRDAHEQDGEGDGDQVERVARQGGEAGRQQQTQDERQQDRQDQPPGPHGQGQPDHDQHKAADQAGDGALRHGGELLVRQGHRPGDAHACLTRRHELLLLRGLPQGTGRGGSGLQRAVVLDRLRQHEAVGSAQVGHLPGQQPLPGQRYRVPRRRRRQRGVEAAQRRLERPQVGPLLDATAHQGQRREQPTGAGIGHELPQEGLGVYRLVQQGLQHRAVQQQEALLAEVGRGVRPANGVEVRRVRLQRGGQPGGRRVRHLGLVRLDDGHQQVAELRELPLQLGLPLLPRQGSGEQAVHVGRDLQAAGGQPNRPRRERQAEQQHEPRAAGGGKDDLAEDRTGRKGDGHGGG